MCVLRAEACPRQFHDHVNALTRQNVFAGLAGFYLLRPESAQSAALDALFPGVYDFPLALQDRSFTNVLTAEPAGPCLCYSVSKDMNDLALGTWQPEWAGRVSVVNGKVWPVMEVAQRPYRFRVLDGTNGRTYNLNLEAVGDNKAQCEGKASWYLIGTEGGLYCSSRCVQQHCCAALLSVAD